MYKFQNSRTTWRCITVSWMTSPHTDFPLLKISPCQCPVRRLSPLPRHGLRMPLRYYYCYPAWIFSPFESGKTIVRRQINYGQPLSSLLYDSPNFAWFTAPGAPLGNQETRCGRSGRLCSDVDGLKDRYSAIELQTHIACSKFKDPQASWIQGTGYPGGDHPLTNQ